MNEHAVTRLETAREKRVQFFDHRRRFIERHTEKGLIEGCLTSIARQEVPTLDALKAYWTNMNRMVVEFIEAVEDRQRGRTPDPELGGYMIVRKECVDSRTPSLTVLDLLARPILHERTAGSIVRKGRILGMLDPSGVAFIETHEGCGAEAAAHAFHTKGSTGTYDHHLIQILTSIPYAVAVEPDPNLRGRLNALTQAHHARMILERKAANGGGLVGYGNPVHAIMNMCLSGNDVVWVDRSPEHALVAVFRLNVQMFHQAAKDEGRTMTPQFATAIVMYDPYRLGRFNDPRLMFGALPNEMFPVTFKFRDIANPDVLLSSSAIGSVKYAGFHDTGHVEGVGGKKGNKLILIVDPDPNVRAAVRAKLLAQIETIKTQTRDGETIVPVHYDLETRRISFPEV